MSVLRAVDGKIGKLKHRNVKINLLGGMVLAPRANTIDYVQKRTSVILIFSII